MSQIFYTRLYILDSRQEKSGIVLSLGHWVLPTMDSMRGVRGLYYGITQITLLQLMYSPRSPSSLAGSKLEPMGSLTPVYIAHPITLVASSRWETYVSGPTEFMLASTWMDYHATSSSPKRNVIEEH